MIRSIVALSWVLAACAPVPVSVERADQICAERARAAAGPTGRVTVGANSNSGPFSRVSVGVSSDFLRGRDPAEVYQECFFRRTGQVPASVPVLR